MKDKDLRERHNNLGEFVNKETIHGGMEKCPVCDGDRPMARFRIPKVKSDLYWGYSIIDSEEMHRCLGCLKLFKRSASCLEEVV